MIVCAVCGRPAPAGLTVGYGVWLRFRVGVPVMQEWVCRDCRRWIEMWWVSDARQLRPRAYYEGRQWLEP